MATIASLAVKLTANSVEFSKGMARTEADIKALEQGAKMVYEQVRTPIEKYRASVKVLKEMKQKGLITTKDYNRALKNEKEELKSATKGHMSFFGVLKGGVGIVAGLATTIAGFAAANYRGVIQTGKFARTIGGTTEGITALRHQMVQLGGDSGDADKGLESLSAAIDEARSGSVGMQKQFQKLGLNIDELANMPVDAAFAKVAEAISAEGDAAKRAATATGIFRDGAASVLPVLAAGKKSADAAKDATEKLGTSFSGIKAGQVEDAAIAFGNLKQIAVGFGQQVAIAVAPYVKALAEELWGLGAKAAPMGKMVMTAMEWIAKSVAYAAEAWRYMKIAVKGVQLAFIAFGLGASTILEGIFWLLGKLPDKMGGSFFRGIKGSLQNINKGLSDTGKEIAKELKEEWNAPSQVDAVNNFFANVRNKAEGAAKATEKLKSAGGSVAIASRNAQLFAAGVKTIEEVQTPLEKFTSTMSSLDRQLQAGAISWDTYARAAYKAVQELEKAHELNQLNAPAAATRFSAEARSAEVRGEREREIQRESPQQRLERIANQSLDIEKKTLEVQKALAKELMKRRTTEVNF